jgi:hypothetical protein
MKSNPFGNVKYEPKASGAFIVDGQEVASTLQCCHCGRHFVSIKGSGKKRGFCLHCNKVTCGNSKCDICIPFEKQLEMMEKQASSGIIIAR